MQYPNINQYKQAIQERESFDSLSEGINAVMDGYNPIFASGNFATVFKMWRAGKPYALKCFLKYIEGREQRQKRIIKYMKENPSDYFIDYDYLINELWVDVDGGNEFSVCWMEWVNSSTLGDVIRTFCKDDNREALADLALKFKAFSKWIYKKDFAHGDLKHDNILVNENGQLILVDYDGMFVPELLGEQAFELGGKDYQHPKRREDTFDQSLDDFSILIIYTSLIALIEDPSLYERYNNDQNIIFSYTDFVNFGDSNLVSELRKIPTLEKFLSKIQESISLDDISIPELNLILSDYKTIDEFKKELSELSIYLTGSFNRLISDINRIVSNSDDNDYESYGDLLLQRNKDLNEHIKRIDMLIIESKNKINTEWWDSLSSDWKSLFLLNINCDSNCKKAEIILKIITMEKFSINFEYSHKIRNLIPLENVISIKELKIQNNRCDLSPISKLENIEILSLKKNTADLSPLFSLSNLIDLNLSSNYKSLQVLKNFDNLKKLSLKLNKSDLAPILLLKSIEKIDLNGNKESLIPIAEIIKSKKVEIIGIDN